MTTNLPSESEVVADPVRPVKAVLAFLSVLVTAFAAAVAGREDRLGDLSSNEWLAIILGTVVTTGLVYGVPNPIVSRRGR
jgi:hypothetical protein